MASAEAWVTGSSMYEVSEGVEVMADGKSWVAEGWVLGDYAAVLLSSGFPIRRDMLAGMHCIKAGLGVFYVCGPDLSKAGCVDDYIFDSHMPAIVVGEGGERVEEWEAAAAELKAGNIPAPQLPVAAPAERRGANEGWVIYCRASVPEHLAGRDAGDVVRPDLDMQKGVCVAHAKEYGLVPAGRWYYEDQCGLGVPPPRRSGFGALLAAGARNILAVSRDRVAGLEGELEKLDLVLRVCGP